jgi:hypothetical protein
MRTKMKSRSRIALPAALAAILGLSLQPAAAQMMQGVVRAWGWNTSGELGNGTVTNTAVPVDVSGLAV